VKLTVHGVGVHSVDMHDVGVHSVGVHNVGMHVVGVRKVGMHWTGVHGVGSTVGLNILVEVTVYETNTIFFLFYAAESFYAPD
jgi:hypothetical protein